MVLLQLYIHVYSYKGEGKDCMFVKTAKKLQSRILETKLIDAHSGDEGERVYGKYRIPPGKFQNTS